MNPTHNRASSHPFHAYGIALELARALVPVEAAIARRDADLAKQLRRASASITLNLGESRRRSGRDAMHLIRIAGGSAAEVMAVLDHAEAVGSVGTTDEARGYCDRVLAMTWRLVHPR